VTTCRKVGSQKTTTSGTMMFSARAGVRAAAINNARPGRTQLRAVLRVIGISSVKLTSVMETRGTIPLPSRRAPSENRGGRTQCGNDCPAKERLSS
jgi:hypothetical protein